MKNATAYVVLDGMDGSGKGTQIELLEKKLSDTAVFTREPGGTPFAEKIRSIVRDDPLAGKSTALNNLLLFFAAREELQHHLVVPALAAGRHVISDRGDSSTFAFQICGDEHKDLIDIFFVMRGLVFRGKGRRFPDLYLMFDLPAKTARERAMRDRGEIATHFDLRDLAYYERVRKGFHEFATRTRAPVVFIDAARPPDEVHELVLAALIAKGVLKK